MSHLLMCSVLQMCEILLAHFTLLAHLATFVDVLHISRGNAKGFHSGKLFLNWTNRWRTARHTKVVPCECDISIARVFDKWKLPRFASHVSAENSSITCKVKPVGLFFDSVPNHFLLGSFARCRPVAAVAFSLTAVTSAAAAAARCRFLLVHDGDRWW